MNRLPRTKRGWIELATGAVFLAIGFLFGLIGIVVSLVIIWVAYTIQRKLTKSAGMSTASMPKGSGEADKYSLRYTASLGYVDAVGRKLAAQGFSLSRNVKLTRYTLDLVARKQGFELSKLWFFTRLVLMASPENVPDTESVKEFSQECMRYALEHQSSSLGRVVGGGFLTVAALVSEYDVDNRLKKWMNDMHAPKYFVAFEFPVLVSIKDRQLYYCKKKPSWGSAYYNGFEKFVVNQLGFSDSG